MEKVIEKVIIKQPGMNPWKKDLKRDVYKKGDWYFIKNNGKFPYKPAYIEVEKIMETWFIK